MILFYILCLLYVLSTASVVCDFLNIIFEWYYEVSNNPICNLKNMLFLSVMQNALLHQQFIDSDLMYIIRTQIAQLICRKNQKKPTRTYMSPYEPSRR